MKIPYILSKIWVSFFRRDEAREELSEFYTSSKELELELETHLKQTEKKATEYQTTCNRLKIELDAERVSFHSFSFNLIDILKF